MRLVEVAPDLPATEVKVARMPTDAAAAVGKTSIATRSYSGRLGGGEGKKVRLRQYARQVDAALRGLLAGSSLPPVLAAVEGLDAIYRSVNTYPHLLARSIEGNPERLSDAELAAAARTVFDETYQAQIADWRSLYETRRNEDRPTSDLVRAARAATYGAVASLLVDIDQTVSGTVDETDGRVVLAEMVGANRPDEVRGAPAGSSEWAARQPLERRQEEHLREHQRDHDHQR